MGLVRQLHARDSRRSFCPEGHWISKQVQITLGGYQPTEFAFRMRGYVPFQTPRALTKELGNCILIMSLYATGKKFL